MNDSRLPSPKKRKETNIRFIRASFTPPASSRTYIVFVEDAYSSTPDSSGELAVTITLPESYQNNLEGIKQYFIEKIDPTAKIIRYS
jgi:flagellum-specific peptidoglycan hydrolase FlgJ